MRWSASRGERIGTVELMRRLARDSPGLGSGSCMYRKRIKTTSPVECQFVLRGGILSSVTTIDFADTIRRRLAKNGQSKYGAAVNSGLPQDAIRYVLNGHVPRLNRVEQICRAIGLELYIGPPRDIQVEADSAEPSRPLTRFDPSVQLPVRVLLPPAPDVYLMKSEEADQTKPAPVDLDDPQAFYALFHGHSMVPTGIGPADFCLVSPCAKLDPGQRIWLRDRKGREGLRWLIRLTAATYEVAAWQPPKPNGHQDLVPERWERKDVDDRGVILAVYRGWLVPSDPAHRLPDWHAWPAHRFVAGAVRRAAGAPGRGSGASGRDDLLPQPADHGLARAGFGPTLRPGGSAAAGREREAVGAVVVPALGRVPQRILSAWRPVDRPAGGCGDEGAVTDTALASRSPPADSSSSTTCPSAHFPPPARH